MSWDEYYKKHQGRPVRPVFLQVLELIGESTSTSENRFAIDLGCGAGIETADLLRRGWQVMAVDKESSSLEALMKLVPPEAQGLLSAICSGFEDLPPLPLADLVFSYHSLPFCKAESYSSVLSRVRASVKPGGFFAGTLFGNEDQWVAENYCSGLSKAELTKFLDGFEVILCSEYNQMGPTALSGDKRWHFWTIISKKVLNSK